MTDDQTLENIKQLLLNPDWRAVAVQTASAEQFKMVIAGLFELSYATAENKKWQGAKFMYYQIHRSGLGCKLFIEELGNAYEAKAVYWHDNNFIHAVRPLTFKDLQTDLQAIDSLLTQFCGDLQNYLKTL